MEWAFQLLTLSVAFVTAFCGYVHYAQLAQMRAPRAPADGAPGSAGGLYTGNIWVYAMVATDYGGDGMIRHFIDHYHDLGVPYDRFIFVLHHNPAFPDDERSSYGRTISFLRKNNFAFRNWADQYSTKRAGIKFLETAMEVITNPDCWIVRLDVDELLATGGLMLRQIVSQAEAENASYIEGTLIDRLAPGGVLRRVRPQPHILAQFPVECLVVDAFAGPRERIVAFKGFLRTDDENHRVVQPRHARAYFSACRDAPAVPHDAGIYKDCFGAEGTEPAKLEGHFHLTPYAHFPSRYAGPAWRPLYPGDRPWRAVGASRVFPVWHVKWHSGLVGNLRDRAAYYRGDCEYGEAQTMQRCTPRHAEWRQAIESYYMVAGSSAAVEPVVPCLNGTMKLNSTGSQLPAIAQ